MTTTELFLIAMLLIFSVPYLAWRLGRTDHYAPLVVVQTVAGILLGPGILGALLPEFHRFVFTPAVIQSLSGLAWWAVSLFVWIAGIELDLHKAWQHRRESGITAGLALGVPLLFGCGVAAVLAGQTGWVGVAAQPWQFIVGIGMACAVTALPVLILLMDKLDVLRRPLGQRILRYSSLDDIAIWAVLAAILMDWERIGREIGFLLLFAFAAWGYRKLMPRLPQKDRWFVGVIVLVATALGADWAGLHFIVGAFLAGAVTDSHWFDEEQLDALRHNVLLVLAPVYFLSTGLRTNWQVGGSAVLLAALALLAVSVVGKLIGVQMAGRILRWKQDEASLIGWFLQTKGLVMIIFANVLLDKKMITDETFTALLLMAVGSTMLTTPMVTPYLRKMKEIVFRST
jgi:Kef-type K+ transport system membrane component KefB